MNLRFPSIASSSVGLGARRAGFRFVVSLLLASTATALATDYYVSPSGSDSNPGTLAAPFATIPKAVSVVGAGDSIFLRGGTHAYSSTITIAKAGTSSAPIKMLAYQNEQPILDFSTQPYGSNNRGILITTAASWWQFFRIEIAHAGDNGVKVEGSHLRFERCVFHHNGDSGLQIGFGHTDSNPGGQLAAFVDVIDCDSYRNYDPDNRGADADGFAAKLHCGQGIVFTGCRSWENSDDGWDLFETDYSVVIQDCWTWHNGDGALFPGSGSFQGNGNGFKLGGDGAGGPSLGTHYLLFSVSFNNKFKSNAQGITNNSHKDGLVIYNCLSFSNGPSAYNYFIEGGLNSGKSNLVTNCVSFPRTGSATAVSLDPNVTSQNCSWTLPVAANAADYGDLSEAAASAPRQANGSLPADFARLVAGSDLIDKGVNVGVPFSGSAPDLGPDEFVSGGTQPPAAPSGLSATAISSSQINLAWVDNANNETGFSVERATGAGTFSAIASLGANVTSYQSTGLAPSTTYSYRVRASNSGGNSGYSNTASATTQPGTLQPPATPTGLNAMAGNAQVALNWSASASATSYNIKRATVSGGPYSTVGTAANTSFTNTSLTNGTTYFFVVSAVNSAGESGNSNQASATPSAPSGTTVILTSLPTEDGRVLESSETSSSGGSTNSADATVEALRTGDDASDRQFRSVVSFDTSAIPDGATIVSATLRLRRGFATGTNAFTTHGSLFADIKAGSGFGNSVSLQTGDFQAAADATQVATLSAANANGDISSGALNAAGRGFINKTGKTQLRVYFSLDDNDDTGADYIGWHSGNDATAGNRPTLEVTYQ
jgi:pectate disaccharide-lyase